MVEAPSRLKTLSAFAIIYLVWGSSFLAIRVGVREVPPFLLAGMRFFFAGLAMVGWTLARGEGWPSARQWRSAAILGLLIFVGDYGLLFWAEQRVPSGMAAVMMANVPLFMVLSEAAILGKRRISGRLATGLLIGIGGVAVLMSRSVSFGGAPINWMGAVALIIAAMNWSVASVLMRKLPLPPSQVMSPGTQMLCGGVLLLLTASGLGEFGRFHPAVVSHQAWLSLLYLTVAASIMAFTAYVWLMRHQSPSKVGTFAYVNPVVAVMIGHFLGGEPIGARTILGTALILASVVVITTARASPPPAAASCLLEPSEEVGG